MNCPRCQNPLAAKAYEAGVEVGECPQCHGLWLDPGELDRIEQIAERDYDAVLSRPVDTVARSFEMSRQRALPLVKCPKCGAEMERRECHYSSGILVDQCPTGDGYWLDRAELEALEAFSERMRLEERRDEQRGFFATLRRLIDR